MRSILDPNAEIVQGFDLLAITTLDGTTHTGVLKEESGLGITLARADGPPLSLKRPLISGRSSLRVSPMPPYAAMLDAAQCADVVAFLMAQKTTAAAPPTAEKVAGFSEQREKDGLRIAWRGQPVADYTFRHAKIPRPFFSSLRAPDGTQLTRSFPPEPGDAQDHADLHPGLWLAFGDLNGVDFWRNKGRVEHVRFTEEPRVAEGALAFTVEERYVASDGREVCRGVNRFRFTAHAAGTVLAWEATLRRADGPLTFGPQHEMGMGFRMATPLIVRGGAGSITGSHGGRNEAGNWGRIGQWWDYAGEVAGRRAGILAIAGQENARAIWSHARDYGFLALSPTGPPPDAKDVPSVPFTIPAGGEFTMRAAFLLHSQPAGEKWDAAAAAKAVAGALGARFPMRN